MFRLIPFPKNPQLCLSETVGYNGSNPASTSDDNIFEKQNTLSKRFGLFCPNLFNISEMKKSNMCDSIPVFPMLPISSLSVNIHTAVVFTFPSSIIAAKLVYAHTLSSCPYAATMLSSNPRLRALNCGTNSNSELVKSISFIPYFLFNIFNMFNFTCSALFPSAYGILPTNNVSDSPSTPLFNFFSICSTAKCGKRSVIVNIGSLSSSPIIISTFSPFGFTTTPCILSGIVVH